MRRVAGGIVGLLLILVGSAASVSAQGCYPPPCGSPAPTAPAQVLAPGSLTLSATDAASHGSDRPLPFVLGGLVVIGSALLVIVLNRRIAMAGERWAPEREREREPEPEPEPELALTRTPVTATTGSPAARREPTRSFG